MSADNWTYCPNCKLLADERTRLLAQKVTYSYGKVPSDEYLAMLKTLRAGGPELEETFREDYEIGLQPDGSFEVSYSGRCEACDAHFEFKYKKPSFLKVTARPDVLKSKSD